MTGPFFDFAPWDEFRPPVFRLKHGVNEISGARTVARLYSFVFRKLESKFPRESSSRISTRNLQRSYPSPSLVSISLLYRSYHCRKEMVKRKEKRKKKKGGGGELEEQSSHSLTAVNQGEHDPCENDVPSTCVERLRQSRFPRNRSRPFDISRFPSIKSATEYHVATYHRR